MNMNDMHAHHNMDMTTQAPHDHHNMHNMDGSMSNTGSGGMQNMAGMHDMAGMHMNHSDGSCMGGMMQVFCSFIAYQFYLLREPDVPMMFFHTGNCEYILFKSLFTTTAGEMGGACVAIFFLAVLYEGLKVLREYLLRRSMRGNKYSEGSRSFSADTSVVDPSHSKHNGSYHLPGAEGQFIGRTQMLSCGHFVQTILHVLQVFISYCLMLVFMTYNAWLCIAVILGAGAGYFLFGWRRAVVVDINEHCH